MATPPNDQQIGITGYAAAVDIYWNLSWRGLIALAAATKKPPPAGFTGYDGIDPSYADITKWKEQYPDGNLALRMAETMIGLDVDAHSGKQGGRTLAEAENRWGELPPTYLSSSRRDNISGIRLFRIPAGVKLRDRIEFTLADGSRVGDIEVIQRHHRYALVWPSVHDKTGEQYQWYATIGWLPPLRTDAPPAPGDIPELPAAWIDGLRDDDHRNGAETGAVIPADVWKCLTDGEPSGRVAAKLTEALEDLTASRHDNTRDHCLTLLRYGKRHEPGTRNAVTVLGDAFVTTVAPDRPGGAKEAKAEFVRFIVNARAAKLLAEPNTVESYVPPATDPPDWPPPDDKQVASPDPLGGATPLDKTGNDFELAVHTRLRNLHIDDEARRRFDNDREPPVVPLGKSLDQLLAEPDTDTDYLIDQLAPVGARTILSAQYKAGKTTTVENLLRSLADDEMFLGHFSIQKRMQNIVLIDNEMSENMLRKWLRTQDITNTAAIAKVFALRGKVGTFNLIDDRCRAEWASRLRDLNCDYLILDCLRPILDALGLDENRDAGRFLVAFDALLAEAGINDALIVHHMGHGQERSRGDSRLQDWPDAIWRIMREDEQPDSPRFFSAYGRDVDVPEGGLQFDPATRRTSFAGASRKQAKAAAEQDKAYQAILEILADFYLDPRDTDHGLGTNTLKAEASSRYQIGNRKVTTALAAGLKAGTLETTHGPNRRVNYAIVNPCLMCGKPVTDPNRQVHHECEQ